MSLGRAALRYAEMGWPVFPCRPRGKEPLVAHGVLEATTDATTIAAWWSRWPDANVAIGCRALFVVDVDPRNGGDDELVDLEREHGKLPHTVEQLTPSGGRHIVFAGDAELRWRKTIAPGLDVQAGRGKYFIAAPSVHPNGGTYAWEVSSHPLEVAVADAPSWLFFRAVSLTSNVVEAPTGAAADSLLGLAFRFAGDVVKSLGPARLAVRCPWRHLHHTKDSTTCAVVFAPSASHPCGRFYCSHESHGIKSIDDVLEELPGHAVLRAAAELLERRAAKLDADDAAERAAIQAEGDA